MDKCNMTLMENCRRIAGCIDCGDNDGLDRIVCDLTGCNDAGYYLENLANITYILSDTLEYAGAFCSLKREN